MQLQLYITKYYGLKYRSKGLQIKCTVIDKEKALTYPQNFLCLLPKLINPKLKQQHKFVELFGEKSPQIAHDLLSRALEEEIDVDHHEELPYKVCIIPIEIEESFVGTHEKKEGGKNGN